MRVSNEDCSPVESTAETKPHVRQALLRFSEIISQYFTRCGNRRSLNGRHFRGNAAVLYAMRQHLGNSGHKEIPSAARLYLS